MPVFFLFLTLAGACPQGQAIMCYFYRKLKICRAQRALINFILVITESFLDLNPAALPFVTAVGGNGIRRSLKRIRGNFFRYF
jgi:hypothetical protein